MMMRSKLILIKLNFPAYREIPDLYMKMREEK
jgi:hypothetical protein